MGGQNSNLRRCIEEEFRRLATHDKQYLVLEQVLALRLPPSSWSLDLSHLGVLFVLDRDMKGYVTLSDLLNLTDLAYQQVRRYQPHEFQAQMQGFCTLQLWKLMIAEGKQGMLDWVTRLLQSNGKPQIFTTADGEEEEFLHEDTVKLLYNMFRVEETQGMEFSDFLTLLQQVGEDDNLMALSDEQQDNWVPLNTVRQLLNGLNEGILKVMREIFPPEEMKDLEREQRF